MPRTRLACVAAILLFCWPSAAGAQWRLTSCTNWGKNLFVRDVLTDIYYWYAELPAADPFDYPDPESYLEAMRYRPLDSYFSYITSREANQAFYGESQYVGFGMSTTITGLEMRVLQVFPDSPAAEAGLARGDRITAIGGRSVAELIVGNLIDTAFGPRPAQPGYQTDLQFVDRAGVEKSATMVTGIVTIPTVSLTRTYDIPGGRRIGYIFFRNFVEPSFAALDEAFAEVTAARVDDLVLDLRYNGGGLVRVAQHLASLVGGVRTRGQVLAEYFHNDKNLFRNEALRFEDKPNAATLNRLIVITTPASASASELLINALRPFMPVVVIGDRTYGKPVGQYQIEFCDKMLAPVSFTLRNANGEGDFFEGFPPDCAAPDDVEHDLGDAAEGSLREALVFATTGACSPQSTMSRLQRLDPGRRAARAIGWQSLVNAY
ncbi:MAG: S41 family peptidase [Vicinamibacterales bacterium]